MYQSCTNTDSNTVDKNSYDANENTTDASFFFEHLTNIEQVKESEEYLED